MITTIDKTPVRSASDLRNKIGLLRVGDVAKLAVLGAGKPMVIRATVATPVQKFTQGGQINPLPLWLECHLSSGQCAFAASKHTAAARSNVRQLLSLMDKDKNGSGYDVLNPHPCLEGGISTVYV